MSPTRPLRFILSLAAILVTSSATTLAAEKPYNLVIIQTDEHHYGTLGCYGEKIVGTPNIDWLASNGALCTSFYATTPVCSPSRAAFVSGRYPQKTPVVNNNIPLDDSVVTFAEILRRHGYATGYAGKWHLDGAGKPQWAPKRKFGFEDNRFMFNRGHWKKLVDSKDGPRVGSRNANGKPNYSLNGANEKTFSTDWLTSKAINFIQTNHDKPFCYMLSIPDPHGPNTVRAPYDSMYADVKVPIPATLKKVLAKTPAWGRSAGVTAAQLRKSMPLYFGMVKCIDDNLGRLLTTLRERDLIDRTIIIFTSDHGDLCGEHGRLNKGVPYEGSARIPFIVCCPGKIKPATVCDEALSCVDFLPTAMRLMDVTVKHEIDGRDASPLLTGNDADWEDIAFLRSTSGGPPWLCGVTKRFKLVYSAADKPWLIDMQDDPKELINRFGDADYQAHARAITQKLLKYARAHHDNYARVPAIQTAMAAALRQ
jgi:arylsulfatase A-like enzyme